MQTMKNPAILGLLILGITGAGLAADGQEAPISLEAAREHGRAESRFLKESTAEATSTPSDAVPASNVAAFRESVEPVLKKSCLACHGPEKSEGRLRIDQLFSGISDNADHCGYQLTQKVLSGSYRPNGSRTTTGFW